MLSPFPVIVTIRIITCLLGDSYKISFATIPEKGDNPTHKWIIPSLELAPRHFLWVNWPQHSHPARKPPQNVGSILVKKHGYHGDKILKINWYVDAFQHHNYLPNTIWVVFPKMQGPTPTPPYHSKPKKPTYQGCILHPNRWITEMQKAAPFVLDIPSFWKPWQVRIFLSSSWSGFNWKLWTNGR